MDDDEAFKTAESFFKNDYHDRGMVKWQGFYLSDHTEDVQIYSQQRERKRQQRLMPELDAVDISNVLFKSYQTHALIDYQLKGKDEFGFYAPIQQGRVSGYVDDEIYIDAEHFLIDDLNWCQLLK